MGPLRQHTRDVTRRGYIRRILSRLKEETHGQDVSEYAIMLAVVLVIVVGMVRMAGANASRVFSQVASTIQ
jgi:Flp pilus assembly pilin Flp